MFFDTAQAGTVQPWLATGYQWGPDGKSITFTLRHGVAWNDGKPFTSADVAFTFNLLKSNTTANHYGLPIASVTTSGPYGVILRPAHPYTQLLASAAPNPRASREELAQARRQRQRARAARPSPNGHVAQAERREILVDAGCRFRLRCPHAMDICATRPPDAPVASGHSARCWLHAPAPG
jgi:oligopeptide/dipeptide ABC transporter ATP-binding protein